MSQVKLLLSPSPRHLNLYLLCSKGILELPNWTPGCAPRTIPHLWITVQGSALQGSPTAAGRGEGQQGDQGPSACYLMQRWVRFLPRSLGTQCWIPQLPEALLSTDRCQIVGGGVYKQETSYLATLLMSAKVLVHQSGYRDIICEQFLVKLRQMRGKQMISINQSFSWALRRI